MLRTDGVCETLYRDLTRQGLDVLYDDLDERPGDKVRDRRSDRHPVANSYRSEGARRGQGRTQERRADGSRELVSPAAAADLLMQ